MNITVLTLGSRGDVQPYVAIGKVLKERGHNLTICTGGTFRGFVENNGLNFYEASIDFMELLKTPEGRAIIEGGGNLFKIIKFAKEVVTPLYKKTFADFYDVTKDSDLIIYHPKAMMAADFAEYYKIPCVCIPPVPMIYPITEFPNLAVSPTRNLGAFLNKLTYLAGKFGESSSMKDINKFRTDILKTTKRKTGALMSQVNGEDIPLIYPISPSLFEDVSSWNGKVEVTGFYYMDMEDTKLDPELSDFIESGKAPIVISFSSMPLKDPERFKKILLEALEETQNRCVVLTGVSGLDFSGHENLLAVEKAPHRLLFKKASGIVHHGGVGTMAEALLSGVPQVIMPFSVDQPFWANRLFKQGYALEALKEKTLTVESLANRFKGFESTDIINKAQEISQKIKKEDGLKKTADYIEGRYLNA